MSKEDKNLNRSNWVPILLGSEDQEYQIYLDVADDGNGMDLTTGKPLKTYEEWLDS